VSDARTARRFSENRDVDIHAEVVALLDDVLSLKGRSKAFRDDTRLLTSVPELDSMAVANVLTSLEERFGFTIADDEIDASTFETLGNLVAFVRGKVEPVR
jgi:acyl carrier protein